MNVLLMQILRLGDAIQMIPVIRGIKQHFPHARIHVLTSVVGKDVFAGEPSVDEVFVLQNKKIADLVNCGRKSDILTGMKVLESDLEPLLEMRWDWIINFSFSYPSALTSFLLETRQRSGYIINRHRQYLSKEKWFALSLASVSNRRYSNFNWVDINKRIIGLPSVPQPPLIVPENESLQNASEHLRSIGFEGKRIIGMHPGASGDYKRWPIERFGALGQTLVNKYDYRVVIFGSEGEKAYGKALKGYMGDKAEDLVGKTDLNALEAFLSLCDVLVSNDTGPMHLASMVGTKVVALFFNSHFVETGPYGKGHLAIHPDMACFPCHGPAKCPHKKCLDAIAPESIEQVLVGGGEDRPLKAFHGRDFKTVKVHISDFDPWGLLDWTPLNKGPVTFETVERLLLKISWLHYADMMSPSNGSGDAYLLKNLQQCGVCDQNGDFKDKLTLMIEKLEGFRGLIEKASKQALGLQTELLKQQPDQAILRHLGNELEKTEDVIRSYDRESSISFLSELLSVYMDSVEKVDLLTLSTRTIGIFRNIAGLADTMINRAKKMTTMLPSVLGNGK